MEEKLPDQGETRYNQLSVPYGKKFEVMLSDGTHVFLNAGSTIRYPVYFQKDKPRDVYLDGEAYFSVAKDKDRPFTVITDQMNTQVYGTEFNVSCYKNENNTSTVLIEGSVAVYHSNNSDGNSPMVLKPGEMAHFDAGNILINQVDVDKYIAWKENKLQFINDRFDVIIKKFERRYDVIIDNQYPALNKKRFTGTFDKETLDQILTVFQIHSPFQFERKGNQYIISPQKR